MRACGFLTFFHKRWRMFNQFLHTYYTFISTLDYKFFIQLSPTLTKLFYIKRDYLVQIIMFKMYTIGRARVQTFAKVVDSFDDRCLWQLTSHPRSAAFIMLANMLDMT